MEYSVVARGAHGGLGLQSTFMVPTAEYDVLVIGGGHAGVEAAWAAANMLHGDGGRAALITMDRTTIGAMSCNPAIGGLAKGQIVREIDALGGLMGQAIDATGIQFRVLNASKGAAVRGPRAQADKYRYATEVRRLLETRTNLDLLEAMVQRFVIEDGRCVGAVVLDSTDSEQQIRCLRARALVLTTCTFMRGLMHTGIRQQPGGRFGERAAVDISATLMALGFELGRLKTGTPPRLAAESIDLDAMEVQQGDTNPTPFSDLTDLHRFPALSQRVCWITHTTATSHEIIRANLHRAPMYNGQIATAGPRYCPSIEDKVVRFADRPSHLVFLEPESLDTNEIYCNGISTSLPADVQHAVVRQMPGCASAKILRDGYAVEYDMVWPHQIDATCMTKRVPGLLLAGQINGTSGYEEAAGQGLLAGVNAVRYARGEPAVHLRRDQAYIGVLMDDLVTKTPREPYRMFTSRAEHRLLLRADNADERLTPLGHCWGLVTPQRWSAYQRRRTAVIAMVDYLDRHQLLKWARGPDVNPERVRATIDDDSLPEEAIDERVLSRVLADLQYAGYIDRQRKQIDRLMQQEEIALPMDVNYEAIQGLRREAAITLSRFRPSTLGQAGRLAGVTPADLMVVSIAVNR